LAAIGRDPRFGVQSSENDMLRINKLKLRNVALKFLGSGGWDNLDPVLPGIRRVIEDT